MRHSWMASASRRLRKLLGRAGDKPEAGGPLTTWPKGNEGWVVEVSGLSRLSARLRELGVVPGTRIRILRSGCPTVIQVEEGRYCLRQKDAEMIRIGSRRATDSH